MLSLAQPTSPAGLVRKLLRKVKHKVRPPPPRPLPFRPDRWSVGIYIGDSPLSLGPAPGVQNPILTPADIVDRRVSLVADPFLARIGSGWQLFVEAESKRGEIALATSKDGLSWSYQGIVLAEPFHLSYPQVFEHGGDVFMVPEACKSDSIRIYRARRYPHEWELVGTLLEGAPFSDATLLETDDGWWMWVEITDYTFDSVHLYHAPELMGPWSPHPGNPVVRDDPSRSRPGGSIIELDGRLIRFVQDCVPSYGRKVRGMEIVRLDRQGYEEVELPESPILEGTGSGWNAAGMHHLDAHQMPDGSWLAAVDGWWEAEEPSP